MLYFSVLFAAFACAINHGQMAGLQLSGLGSQYCAFEGDFGTGADLDGFTIVPLAFFGSGGCAMSSSFSAILLVALFGLFGLLLRDTIALLPRLVSASCSRYLWPSLNPRASPLT